MAAKTVKTKPKKKAIKKGGPSRLAQSLSALNKVHGNGSVLAADQVGLISVPRIRTGIFVVDAATGGGLPIGHMTLVYGDESTGKTTLLIRAVAVAQRMCANCYRICDLQPGLVEVPDPDNPGGTKEVDSWVVAECRCGDPRSMVILWVDQEGTWESGWAAAHGVFEERLLISRPVTAEEAINVIDELVSEGVIDIGVLDSIAAMSPSIETEQYAEDSYNNPGLHARMMNSAIRKWNAGLNRMFQAKIEDPGVSIPSIWMINQTREKIGVMFGDPTTLPGGRAQNFFASMRIHTNRKPKYSVPEDKEGPRKDVKLESNSVRLGVKIVKNKVSSAQQEGTYTLALRDLGAINKGDILDHDDVLLYALRYGVVEQLSASKYSCGGQTVTGKSNVADMWIDDRELYERVKAETLRRHLDPNRDVS